MRHLALLGDSILDNSPYTAPEPDTADCLQRALGPAWTVELLARDGSTMADLRFQLSHLPAHADTAILSIGGNDAIEHIGILNQAATSSGEVLARLADIASDFGSRYRRVLLDLRPRVTRLIVCTIYEPPLSDPTAARLAHVPLSLLNDQIIREATKVGVDILDLRTVCSEPADFVKEIEPSPAGARKIAAAIHAVVHGEFSKPPSSLFAV
jgi:lysophospholipase L1-like esterase